ncbi:hypothetical protein [Rhodosalinus sediminis]|uniref:hypothetical protein n=1 Tax=Rhodosalinus sediminis TaxID=1940533 RepID=UPI0013143256|nr:hypothetical protein [Rhodosalinus sediminis]
MDHGDFGTMSAISEEIKALEQLGRQLEEVGWTAPAPVAEAFEVHGPQERKRRIVAALAYLKVNDSKIRSAICSGSAVRDEITAGGVSVATVADSLQATGGFVVPVWSLANTLCQLGLTKYCARSTSVTDAVAESRKDQNSKNENR